MRCACAPSTSGRARVTRARVATRAKTSRRTARATRERRLGRGSETTARAIDDARRDVSDVDAARDVVGGSFEVVKASEARTKKEARRAFTKFLLERDGGAAPSAAATLAHARGLAEARNARLSDVIWAPALWASVARVWSAEDLRKTLVALEGSGAADLTRRLARRRDARGCEIIYKECIARGYDDGGGEVTVEMAKVLAWTPGRKNDAERLWGEIFERARGDAKRRCEAHCALLEARCLRPTAVHEFLRAYDAFRDEFRNDEGWKSRWMTPMVQRAYTAACRLCNDSHDERLARRVTYDLLRDHKQMKAANNFALATEYCVSSLLSAATPSSAHAAAELFEVALEDGVKFGGTAWSYAVSMYAGMNKADEAIALLDRLETLDFMQSGSLGALAFAAAFSGKKSASSSDAVMKLERRANDLKMVEARNAKERAKVERAYAQVMHMLNKQERFKLALRMFTRMQSSGVRPLGAQTYINLYDALSETPADDALSKSKRRDNLHRVMQTVKTHLKSLEALMVGIELASHAGVADVCEDIQDRLRWNGHLQSDSVRSRVWQCMMIVRYKTYDRQGTMQLYEEWLRSGEEKIAVGDDFWFYLIKSYCDDPVNVDVAALLLEDAIRENAMVRRKTVPVRTFNIVIQACAQDRRPALALTVIDRMRAAGVNPTDVTYLAALRACASAAKIDRRRDEKAENDSEESLVRVARTLIVTACTEGIQPTSKMWSAALHVCALCGDVAAATEIFADMRASGSAPNVHSCTALMRAYASVRDLSGAIDAYWTMRNEFDVAPDSSTLQTMLEVVRAAGHNKSRGTSDVISRVQEVYADMRALNVRPNNAVLSLLTESVVEDVLALGSPNSAIDVKRLTLAIDGCVSVESEITQTWDDIASMNLKEYSVAEARVAFLGLLQTLRDRRAARLRVGDVRVGVGRGKIRDSIETLARDVSLMLSYAEDDDGVVVLTSAAIEHWFAKP